MKPADGARSREWMFAQRCVCTVIGTRGYARFSFFLLELSITSFGRSPFQHISRGRDGGSKGGMKGRFQGERSSVPFPPPPSLIPSALYIFPLFHFFFLLSKIRISEWILRDLMLRSPFFIYMRHHHSVLQGKIKI